MTSLLAWSRFLLCAFEMSSESTMYCLEEVLAKLIASATLSFNPANWTVSSEELFGNLTITPNLSLTSSASIRNWNFDGILTFSSASSLDSFLSNPLSWF